MCDKTGISSRIEPSKERMYDEVRDGFFVPSMMKKAWYAQLKDYKVLEEISDEIGVNVSLTWGSLLGAVRCGGFIPWDDDIDAEMFHEDYLKLEKYGKEHGFPDRFLLSDYRDTHDFNMVKRFEDSDSPVRTPEEMEEFFGFPLSAMIDIFVLDHIPRDAEQKKKYLDIIAHATFLRDEAKYQWDEKNGIPVDRNIKRLDKKSFEREKKRFEDVIKLPVSKSEDKPLFVRIMEAVERFSEEYDKDKCDEVALLTYYTMSSERIVPKALYKRYIDMPFEDTTVRIPIGYDGIMRRYFGCYAYPALLFSGHMYPNYEHMEEQLKDKVNAELVHYHFFKDKYDADISKRQIVTPLHDEVDGYIDMLVEAHSYVEGVLNEYAKDGDIEINNADVQISEIKELIGQCQNMAIQLGQSLEDRAVNPEEPVKKLEEYCDKAYEIYQAFEGGVSVDHLVKMTAELREYETTLRALTERVEKKKKIVFLPYRKEHWLSLHTIWEAAVKDDKAEVSVVPVPYFNRKNDGSIDKDHMILESDGYPDEVEIIPYDEYDFERIHPDVIITQCPYDGYSDIVSIHPYFYCENLIRLTDRLVLIPPFVTREIVAEDARSRQSIKYFLDTPGFIYADAVIAQSGQMREVYIELLQKFMKSEDSEGIIDWESKVIGAGSALFDKNGKGGLSEKRLLIYAVTASMMYEAGFDSLKKIKKAMEILNRFSNRLEVVWRIDPYAKDILTCRDDDLYEQYLKLIEEIRENGNCIIYGDPDRAKDINAWMSEDDEWESRCDAYYGDTTILLNNARMHGKPILWQMPEVMIPDEVKEEEYKDKYDDWNNRLMTGQPLIILERDCGLYAFSEYVCKQKEEKAVTGNGERIWKRIMGDNK